MFRVWAENYPSTARLHEKVTRYIERRKKMISKNEIRTEISLSSQLIF
jgi:hypothetical protein